MAGRRPGRKGWTAPRPPRFPPPTWTAFLDCSMRLLCRFASLPGPATDVGPSSPRGRPAATIHTQGRGNGMLRVDEARSVILEAARPLPPQTLPLASALVLAE